MNLAVNIKNSININKKRFWAGILLVQFFLFYLMSKSHEAISWFNQLFELKKEIHQLLFSKFGFSAGDVFYIILSSFLLFLIIKLFNKKTRSNSAFQLIITFNVFYFIYQFSWGMLYFQKPLIYDLPKEKININEAKSLSLKFLKSCIEERKLVSENQNGVFIINNLKILEQAVLVNQHNLPKSLIKKKPTDINNFKSSLFDGVLSFTGVLGYYNPFTSEAQYNSKLPASFIPFTLAHESSHQLGYAREQEANFVGYLIGKNSANSDLKYSTDLFALKSLLNFINENDPEFVEEILNKYSAGMKRDRANDKLFMLKHQSFLNAVFAFTNNLFLKSNQQEGSITYSYFTELLIKYERTQP